MIGRVGRCGTVCAYHMIFQRKRSTFSGLLVGATILLEQIRKTGGEA